ncbi:MAG: ABC transporter substrate-binding protein [Actinomycetia bacterium]|nr:ABC transporter substrate-binding protein [Actinomycetes bacterium]
MKKFLLIVIILLICMSSIMVNLVECSSSTSIHTGKISGVINVYWPGIGFKPGRARIDILNTGLFTISSSYGNYILSNVPVGQHTITVFKHGYTPAQKIINVAEGQKVTDVDFNLMVGEPGEKLMLGSIFYLGFNFDYQPFNNLKVRQALNYAIDKQALVDELNSKLGRNMVVAQGPLPPGMIGYNPNFVAYPYNINTAKELLSQAGYPKGFNIDLYYLEGNSFQELIVKEVKKYLAQIGIKVDRKGKKWDQLLNMIEQDKLPFFALGWRADTPDPADYLFSLYHSKGSSNNVHYYNSIIDNQIEQAWEIIDKVDFVQLIQQIEKTIVDDAPAIYINKYMSIINK